MQVDSKSFGSISAGGKHRAVRCLILLVLAAIMGLVASVGVAFISEYLDHSFRDEEDVKRYLGLPVLASIPEKKKGISGGTGNI